MAKFVTHYDFLLNLLCVLSLLQTRDGALAASKSTQRKKKKPSTQRQRTEEHIRYPVYVLLSEYLLVIRNSLKVSRPPSGKHY